jgi:hypothetical protein
MKYLMLALVMVAALAHLVVGPAHASAAVVSVTEEYHQAVIPENVRFLLRGLKKADSKGKNDWKEAEKKDGKKDDKKEDKKEDKKGGVKEAGSKGKDDKKDGKKDDKKEDKKDEIKGR